MAHTHDHHHHHGHSHDHHSHGPANYNSAFALGITLNFGFVIVEGCYGYFAHSLALFADAGHNLSDVLGLCLAWGASVLAKRTPSPQFTYGLRNSSIFAAIANAVFLLVAIGGIAWEAIHRFSEVGEVKTSTVMAVAAIGILINGFTAFLFMSGRENDLNLKGAYLHMVADAAISAGVVAAALLMSWTGLLWIDPTVSLLICAVIVWGTWDLLRDSVRLALNAVPAGVDMKGVQNFLKHQKGVTQVHDLHIWAMSTTENALTAHLVMPAGHPGDEFLESLSHALEHDFKIHHTTVQIEMGTLADGCRLASDDVV